MENKEFIDFHLDAILKASGSGLKNYSMHQSREGMRKALRAALASQAEAAPVGAVPYGWINAGTKRQQTEYATLHVGPENPWMDSANAFPVYTAPPAAAKVAQDSELPLYFGFSDEQAAIEAAKSQGMLGVVLNESGALNLCHAFLKLRQQDSGRDAALREAVGKLIKAKGRYHTEQNYAALVTAYDDATAAQQGEKGGDN